MTTKPDTDTGWSKGLPDVEGDYFSRVDEYDKQPTLIRIQDGVLYEIGQGGNLRREYAAEVDYEYLGPFTSSDFEQLLRLRAEVSFALVNAHQWVLSDWQNWLANHLIPLTREALTHTGEQS